MIRKRQGLLLLGATALMASACTNPTVDPNATFTAEGVVVDQTGAPLVNAEVRLIKYWSNLNVFQPSAETVFADDPQGNQDLGLGVEVVRTVNTNDAGEYEFEFTGNDISKPGGFMNSLGEVEVADVVVVVRDPSDDMRQSGVYTYSYVYQKAAKNWDAGELPLWDSLAEADVSDSLTSGQVKLSWAKLERSSSTMVKNAYRVWIEAASGTGPRYTIYCNQGDVTQGGCAEDAEDTSKLSRYVSAYSVRAYYSDPDGSFAAYVQGNSPDYRFVSRFMVVDPVPDLRDVRDQLQVEAWAVDMTTRETEELTGTAAMDGAPGTRYPVGLGSADAVYVKLIQNNASPLVSDAGILNSLVRNARDGCLTLEFSVNAVDTVDGALDITGWEQKGKFCGENGSANEVSALASFDTTSQAGVSGAWMRVTADSGLAFDEIGEVAVFQKK